MVIKKKKTAASPRKFAASATVTLNNVHAATGSRVVTIEMRADGHVGATGVLTLGGAQIGSQLRVSPGSPRPVNVPDLPMEYEGQTAGGGEYTLRARVGGQTIGSTTGTAPDFFTLEF